MDISTQLNFLLVYFFSKHVIIFFFLFTLPTLNGWILESYHENYIRNWIVFPNLFHSREITHTQIKGERLVKNILLSLGQIIHWINIVFKTGENYLNRESIDLLNCCMELLVLSEQRIVVTVKFTHKLCCYAYLIKANK